MACLLQLSPGQREAGTAVSLQVEVHLTKDPLSSCEIIPDYDHVRLVNELRVSFAPAPLPRFGSRWLYGDLHYHSQGTDNEGESAYNYRGVIRAMGAMGMDFAFATEHASNSRLIVDVDAGLFDIHHPEETRIGLRDMSEARFSFLHGVLHGARGANREAPFLARLAGRIGRLRTPQVFLGGEVDLIPELRPGTRFGDVVPWGNAQEWSTDNLCFGPLFGIGCEAFGVQLLEQTATNPDAVLVDDVQAFSVDFGRHHIVYLPRSAADRGAFVRSDTGRYGGAGRRFVDLQPEIERHGYFFAAHPLTHYERGGFLTDLGPTDIPWTDHLYDQVWRSPAWLGLQYWNEDARLREPVPAWGAFTTSPAVPSPDFCLGPILNPGGNPSYICPEPGGDAGYERNDSPAIGLPHATLPVDRPRAGFGSGLFHLDVEAPVTGRWAEYFDTVEEKLHHGAFTWDRLNHWGLDVRKTTELDWLPSFLAPRRLFMAGGSDAHGDLGYRRTGYLIRTEKINDAALGKPRNLVEVRALDRRNPRLAATVPPIAPDVQAQVAGALADGRFSITDGPALRIAVDRNSNGIIDEDDAAMGEVVSLRVQDKSVLPLLVEWKSTPEFGPVARVDLYVGARSSRDDLSASPRPEPVGRTYAPAGAGVFHSSIPGNGVPDTVVDDPPYDRMGDNYWKDPTGLLRFKPENGFAGAHRVSLDLNRFPAMANRPADRFFVRAFAVTETADPGDICVADHDGCLRRYAFTNPIWAVEDSYLCSADARLDDVAPAVSCNAPATIRRRNRPESFTATATDVCPSVVAVSDAQCDAPGDPNRPRSRRCRVEAEGDTLAILRGGRPGTTIRWTATATDAAGNTASTLCQTEVGRPGDPSNDDQDEAGRGRGAGADRSSGPGPS